MSWLKIDDRFPRHPKVAHLSDKAFRTLVESWCYCAEQQTDGIIHAAALRSVAKKVSRELVTSDLWHPNPDGTFTAHDYLDYNPSRDQVLKDRAEAKERMQRSRRRSPDVQANKHPNKDGTSAEVRLPRPDPSRPVPEDDVEDRLQTSGLGGGPGEGEPDLLTQEDPIQTLRSVLRGDQPYLLESVVKRAPAFADLSPGYLESVRAEAGNETLTEMLRVLASIEDLVVAHPRAYLEEIRKQVQNGTVSAPKPDQKEAS